MWREHDWRTESDEVIEEGVFTPSPLGERDEQETQEHQHLRGCPPKRAHLEE